MVHATRALEKELGQSIPSEAAGKTLRVLLLDAGQALSDGRPALAIRAFGAAQTLCRAEGLVPQECATGIGLGSAHLAAGDEQAALEAYVHAAQRALAAKLPPLAAQAMLGVAGVHFGKGSFAQAREAYAAVAHLAINVPSLAQEAERMEQKCGDLTRLRSGDAWPEL
jgi:hypothetical protein